jgi:hypothetical protein
MRSLNAVYKSYVLLLNKIKLFFIYSQSLSAEDFQSNSEYQGNNQVCVMSGKHGFWVKMKPRDNEDD